MATVVEKITWNRAEDGVVTIYGTIDGKAVDLADLWSNPLRKAGIKKAQIHELQEKIVKILQENWSNDVFVCPISYPGCTKDCGSYGCGN